MKLYAVSCENDMLVWIVLPMTNFCKPDVDLNIVHFMLDVHVDSTASQRCLIGWVGTAWAHVGELRRL